MRSGFQSKKVKEKRFKRRYLSKSQARTLLQLDNKEFKRLLIFKGIYPRVPKRFLNSTMKDKTHYSTKEIKKLVGDPIIAKIREYHAHLKKASAAKALGDDATLDLIEKSKPQYDLSSTILERYPTFSAALTDMSDALSMVFLYSYMPPAIAADSTIEGYSYLTTSMHQECKALAGRWRSIVSAKRALRKGFISVKGYYYQAVLDDYAAQSVLWLDPHSFAPPKSNKAIEHRVMLNYVEFYIAFLKFVCFKLESDMEREKASKADDKIAAGHSEAPRAAAASDDRFDAFRKLTFFVSRESSPMQVRFVLQNMGCGIAKAYTDEKVTHYVIDRPAVPVSEEKLAHVDYVQPQYVFDCLNKAAILPVAGYGIGEQCPPHVSPFVAEEDAADVPMKPQEEILDEEVEESETDIDSVASDAESVDDEIREAPFRSEASAKKVAEQLNFSEAMKKKVKAKRHTSDENFGAAEAANLSKKMRGLYSAAKHAHTAATAKKQEQQIKRAQIQKGVLGVSKCGKYLQPK